MATRSSTLAWKIPWTEEPSGLQFMGSQRVGHDLACLHTKGPQWNEEQSQDPYTWAQGDGGHWLYRKRRDAEWGGKGRWGLAPTHGGLQTQVGRSGCEITGEGSHYVFLRRQPWNLGLRKIGDMSTVQTWLGKGRAKIWRLREEETVMI